MQTEGTREGEGERTRRAASQEKEGEEGDWDMERQTEGDREGRFVV